MLVGGVMKFNISPKLVSEIKNIHAKYKANLAQIEKIKEEGNKCKNKQLQMQLLDRMLKLSWMKLN